MRFLAFYLVWMIYAVMAAWMFFAPMFDRHEARFVVSLTKEMAKKPQGEDLAWLGPPVETAASVLVAGRLVVSAPAEDEDYLTRGECAAIRKTWYTEPAPMDAPMALDTRVPYDQSYSAGANPMIGGWVIDERFFQGHFAPYTKEIRHGRDVKCKTIGNGLPVYGCELVLECIPLADMSIIGNKSVDPKGNKMVRLPNKSLIDYPLMHAGLHTPDSFGVAYMKSMSQRATAALFVRECTIGLYICGLLMVLCAAGVLNASILRVFARDSFDQLTLVLVVVTPLLPLAAYEAIKEGATFNNFIVFYILAFVVMTVGLIRRLHGKAAPVTENAVL